MEQTGKLKHNAEVEDLFKSTSFCIAHCQTINKSNLTVNEANCLENCGYNRKVLWLHFDKIVQGTIQKAIAGLYADG